jgi:non-canonical (house-cleaning) NTP pyrophosphatase
MRKIVLTSTNPVKLNVVKKVASNLFPDEDFDYVTLALEKDGPEPIGKNSILNQINSAIDSAKAQIPDADYYICMEGGMIDDGIKMNEVAHVSVCPAKGESVTTSCASFPVPKAISDEVRKGKDFAVAVDEFFKTNGTKQGGGFVNILTGGIINKEDHYFQATAIAFSAVVKSDWY